MDKIIIFNFEGGLTKSIQDNSEIFSFMAKRYNFDFGLKISEDEFIKRIENLDPKYLDTIYNKVISYFYSKPQLKKKSLKMLSDFKKNSKLVLLTNLNLDFVKEYVLKHNLENFFERIYSTKKLNFLEKHKIFLEIKKDFNSENLYFLDSDLSVFDQNKILGHVRILENLEKLPKKDLNYKNSFISFDFDGSITDISNHNLIKNLMRKKAFEDLMEREVSIEEYENFFLTNKNEKSLIKDLKVKGYFYYDLEVKPEEKIIEIIKKLSKDNYLVIFSVSSKKRISFLLEKYGLKKYFKKIYSSKDNFNIKTKNKYMFSKIKKLNSNFENYIHFGDLYELDYLESKKAGFESILIDHKKKEIFFEVNNLTENKIQPNI